jgi:hypothetical protein
MPTVDLGDSKSVTLGAKIGEGDLCDIFEGTFKAPAAAQAPTHTGPRTRFDMILDGDDDEVEIPVIIKVVTDRDNNDLLEREILVLDRIPTKDPAQSSFNAYYPVSYGGYKANGNQAHVLSLIPDCFSMADVLRAHPQGIDYRDAAWMFKRTLVGLWYAHQKGFLHGALLPTHVLLKGHNHGATLIDWCYSAYTREWAVDNLPRRSRPLGEPDPTDSLHLESARIRVLLTDYSDFYPPEVPDRREAREGTDIYMAVKCMVALLGGDLKTNEMPDTVPPAIQTLLKVCLNPRISMRPSDASTLHDAFDTILKDLVGPPTFRPFSVPTRV